MVLIAHPSEVPRAVLNILCSFVHSLFTDFCATIIRVQFALENVYPRKTESLGRKVPLLSRFTRNLSVPSTYLSELAEPLSLISHRCCNRPHTGRG